ncbi:hypothetical protein [Streptomyces sp. NPDC014734]|uniref:hypothetical protein n=1 Tax=Streptomyces sp. NPDC014734 TaxID=3364886 RepID=UPI0036F768E1
MTSTTDTSSHPDVSEISDLTEGLLQSARADEVRGHVDGCALCGDVHTSLVEVRRLLGAVPVPQSMPTDIADRIDDALAAAALDSTVPDDSTMDVSRETEPVPAPKPDTSPPTDRPVGRPGAATGPGRRPARRRRRAAVLGTALGAALVGAGFLIMQGTHTPQDTAAGLRSATRDAGSSANDASTFSESTLEDQVQSLLRGGTKSSHPDGATTEKRAPSLKAESTPENEPPASESSSAPLRVPTVSVPSCVEQGIGRDVPALAVSKGSYKGADAFLVVLPHPSDSARVQAYIVDAACTREQGTAVGKLLLTHVYARP